MDKNENMTDANWHAFSAGWYISCRPINKFPKWLQAR